VRFTAVLRASSRAKVRQTDPPLILQNFPSPVGALTIVIRTRYDEKEFAIVVPRELWVEVQGDAPSLEDGLNVAWGATASVLPVIALVTNAAISELQPHLAFETTEGVDDRAFFQSTVETERGIPPPGRRIPIEPTVATLGAIAATGRAHAGTTARLMRAANQYLFALRYWKRHYELLCVSHLFMAAEALKVVALRQALDSGGDQAELAESWGIRPGEPRTRALLEAAARRRLIFHGDHETERKAAEISDGFEHGYRDLGDLHKPSLKVRDKTGRHVRSSFLELAGVPEGVRAELTSGRYEDPTDMTEYVRYVRGRLVGPGDELASSGEEYPFLEWTSAPTLRDAGEGRITISGTETFTVRTADSIGFRAESYEFWGPRMNQAPTDSTDDQPEAG
jgi:hypothetical protein